MQEAIITNETEIVKPEISEVEVKLGSTSEIVSNVQKVKEQVLELQKYYSNKIVTEDNLKEYKDEKSNINKLKKSISDYRISITKEFNKPLETFTTLAKETEKILGETYDLINNQCNNFDEQKKEEKKEEARRYLNELCEKEKIGFITLERIGINITLSSSYKSIYSAIDTYVENVSKDLNTIENLENNKEILVEYMKDCDLSRAIQIVQERHKALDEIKEQPKEEIQEEPKQEILSKPVVEQSVECSFKVNTSLEKLKKLVEYMKSEGISYESI